MLIGKFEKDRDGFTGSIEALGLHADPVHFVHRDKGATYVVRGPDGEYGAAWQRSGEFGEFLTVKLDGPALPAPVNAIMSLTPTDDGVYLLRWQRRNGNGRSEQP
jgi:uncharacterized protein (DUF736 family)